MAQPPITGQDFLDGFLWARASMESQTVVRATASSRPLPLIDLIADIAEAQALEVEFEEVGAAGDNEGSLAMRFRSKEDWVFLALQDPIGARRVSSSWSVPFLQGFLAGRCSMTAALHCSWNRAAPDIQQLLHDLDVDFVVENDTCRIRNAAKHEIFAPFLAARKEERQQMAALASDAADEDGSESEETSGWLYWPDLSEDARADFNALVEVLMLGPGSFTELRDRLSIGQSQDVWYRVALGRAIKTTDLPAGVPAIRKLTARSLEVAARQSGSRLSGRRLQPIYMLDPDHGVGLQLLGLLWTNLEHFQDPPAEFWDNLRAEVESTFSKQDFSETFWTHLRNQFDAFSSESPNWPEISVLLGGALMDGRSAKHAKSLLDFAAGLLDGIGEVDSSGFYVRTDIRTPLVERLLSWVESQAGVPSRLAEHRTNTGVVVKEGILTLPPRMLDVLRAGDQIVSTNVHFAEGRRWQWALHAYEGELPEAYRSIQTDELQIVQPRSSTHKRPPKWLQEGRHD